MDETPDRDEASNIEASAPGVRQVWEKPTLDVVDVRLTMHGNSGGIDGVFSSS